MGIPAPPPVLPQPGLVHLAPAPAADPLDAPIGSVCEQDHPEGLTPKYCFKKGEGFAYGLALLRNTPPHSRSAPPVEWNIIERLLSALRSLYRNGDDSINHVSTSISIRDFRKKNQAQQLAFINNLWDAAAVSQSFDTQGRHMYDPGTGDLAANSFGAMPSSIHPIQPGHSSFNDGGVLRAFRQFGIGFRVDGMDDSAIARILSNGMTQQRLNADLMNRKRGLRIDGTCMTDTTQVRIWTRTADTFNETGVCVSRSFLGACAFPERDTKSDAYLWAVSCGNLLGCDVESYQRRLPNHRNWRPGEKAFQFIPAGCVLAWVKIRRDGCPGGPGGAGWKFTVPAGSTWNYVRDRDDVPEDQRNYIEAELDAFTSPNRDSHYCVPEAFDFAH